MTLLDMLFYLFAITTCGGALGVVICQNIVRMAVSLIVSLASVSGLFFLMHADFVGATRLMVYVGGTIVLLIFGVMLTSNSPFLKIKNSAADMFVASGLGVLFLAMIMFTVGSVQWDALETSERSIANGYNESVDGVDQGNTLRPLALSFVGLRSDKKLRLDGEGAPGYLLPFEIMKFRLGDSICHVEYRSRRDGRFRVKVGEDGDEMAVTVYACGEGQVDIDIDGKHVAYHITRQGRSWLVHSDKGDLELIELPRFPLSSDDEITGGLLAPMPGAVLATEVSKGDKVTKGDLLLILEAMKMEHRITAPMDGIVAQIHVATGDQVKNGQMLVTIDSPEGINSPGPDE